jgi:predicted amidophosphoribosyltransferase
MLVVELLDGLLRPARCLGCGAPGAWPCCARCLPSDPGLVGPWQLAADPQVPLWALGPYQDGLRAAVLAGKLDGQPAALTELGRRLGAALAAAGVGADLVTWVAGRSGGLPRDHAERIGTGVAAALALPAVDLLAPAGGRDLGRARRANRALPDLGLARRADRATVTDRPDRSPPPRPPPRARRRLAGGRVLMVDDLATTGGTLAGAAASLRQAGARRVEAAVLAAAPAAIGRDLGPARLRQATLRGCDPISCVESGQYDQRAVKEDGPHAEVIWQAEPCVRFGLQGSMGGMAGPRSCPG